MVFCDLTFYLLILSFYFVVCGEIMFIFPLLIKDGTWSSILRGCTIVRDFADVCFHSYFSLMDELLESKSETPLEIK